jgi:hypothetical protein
MFLQRTNSQLRAQPGKKRARTVTLRTVVRPALSVHAQFARYCDSGPDAAVVP